MTSVDQIRPWCNSTESTTVAAETNLALVHAIV